MKVGGSARLDREIHFTRVQCKRLLSALRTLKPVFSRREFESQKKQIRRVSRSFAVERDSFVIRKQLTAIASKVTKKEGEQLQQWTLRHIKEPDVQDGAAKLTNAKLKLMKCLNAWPALDSADLSAMFKMAVNKSLRKIRKGFRRVLKNGKANDFHDWRTSIKTLFLQLELARDVGFTVRRGLLDELNALQRALGNVNDARLAIDFIESFGNPNKSAYFANACRKMRRKEDKWKQRSLCLAPKAF
jgi:CHAD domain-containing protein